ncbi:E3 ubiquitin-protein ligase AIRP2-like isoform X2 [Syzygium oleosum]|uniref:E3 ubiquitin-protein ligase AIRP2-like isoform X2 n=1 Tax=Syzygium oleosum TaxID=219896 RepID=UPI0024B94640|nr:E3 ubiquitin-protein ligase AIRP2-like isoform X2 [Syzygium oleosum]
MSSNKSPFRDSLKALEADIQHANTLALDYPRENGAYLQMRLSYSPVAHLFLFLVQWTDCHLAGALGLLRILIYMNCADGKTTMSVYERKASIRDFYAVIFPSLLQLQRGITDLEERKQRLVCSDRYRKKEELLWGKFCELDLEREDECGICLETTSRVILPNCCHSLCLRRARSQSCPFCRDSLKRIKSEDLWIYTEKRDIVDLPTILKENAKRLFMYIDNLPLVVPDTVFLPHDTHCR